MYSEVLEPLPNVPLELAFKFPTGKRIDTKRGPRVLFTTTDERVMFVSPSVADKIEALGIPAGEKLRICMAERPTRTGKALTEWYVSPMGDESFEELLNVKTKPAPAPVQAAKPREAPKPVNSDHPKVPVSQPQPSTNENGKTAPSTKMGYGPAITEFLILGLKAAQDAETWAGSNNCSIRFTSADVQGLASTLFIQAAREGWLTWQPGGAR